MPPESRLSKIRFIALVKKYPCLYNTYLPEYADRRKVDRSWAEISKLTGLTIDQSKMKWKNLRRIFVRGLRPRTNGNYKPAPEYVQKHLEFIRPFIKTHIIEQANQFLYDDLSSSDLQLIPPRDNVKDKNLDDDSSKQLTAKDHFDTPRFDVDECYRRAGSPIENQVQNSENGESLLSASDDVDPSRKLFLLSLLPEIDAMTPSQYRIFRMKVIEAVDTATADVTASSMTFSAVSSSNAGPNNFLRASEVQGFPIIKEENDIDFSM